MTADCKCAIMLAFREVDLIKRRQKWSHYRGYRFDDRPNRKFQPLHAMTDISEQSPTATSLLRSEIERFLGSSMPEVLCIRGKWGVGKTYGWNTFLLSAKAKRKIALGKYAYVSLFGTQSLDELKYSIFENTVGSQDIGTEPTIENLTSSSLAVMKQFGRHSLANVINYIPFVKNASDTLKVISFLSVRDQIVCIDDLERKGEKFRVQDVLGLASFLSERRNCKVVIILNDEELEKADREQLAKYQEKVIDSSLLFAPNEEDCAAIALPNATGARAMLAERSVSLGISNIRIIKKLERLVLRIEPLLKSYEPAVLSQAIQTLTLFGWAYFGRSSDTDTSFIDFILKKRGKGWYGTTNAKKLTVGEARWDGILDAYGFDNADELDLALLDGVRNGFFDEGRIKTAATKVNEQLLTQKSHQSLESAWSLLHDSFDDNGNEVYKGLLEAFVQHVAFVSPSTLSSLMSYLKGVGELDTAKEALDFYMANREEDRSFYDLDSQSFGGNVTDADARQAFAEKLATFKTETNPTEILTRIAKQQGWANADIEALSAMSAADFRAVFKKLGGIELRSAIRAALGFENISNRGTEYDSIIANAKEALRQIAAESKINDCRVRNIIGPQPAVPVGAVVAEPGDFVEDDDEDKLVVIPE